MKRETNVERRTLMIVDDVEINREILKMIFSDEYDFLEAGDGEMALELIDANEKKIAAVLLDIIMPKLNGFGVLKHMRERNMLQKIPVIFITSDNNTKVLKEGYAGGVTDIINKPFDNTVVRTRVHNTIDLYLHKNHLEEMVEQQTRALKKMNNRIIYTLGTLVEFRNKESGDHVQRVASYTRILAQHMAKTCPEYHLTEAYINQIVDSSPMHDVGKIVIPDAVLLKPGRLTAEEFELMKTHTTEGEAVLNNMLTDEYDPEFRECCVEIARWHHEKWDGKGYPDGLVGDQIPISAQLVSLADVYDALSSERCYKHAFSKQTSYEMILNGDCGLFNPKLLQAFAIAKQEMERAFPSNEEQRKIEE